MVLIVIFLVFYCIQIFVSCALISEFKSKKTFFKYAFIPLYPFFETVRLLLGYIIEEYKELPWKEK